MDEKLSEFREWLDAARRVAGGDPGAYAVVRDVIDEFDERFGA